MKTEAAVVCQAVGFVTDYTSEVIHDVLLRRFEPGGEDQDSAQPRRSRMLPTRAKSLLASYGAVKRKWSPSRSCIFEWQVSELGIRPIPARIAGKTNGKWLIVQEHISVPSNRKVMLGLL
jgi:hypothetical protein